MTLKMRYLLLFFIAFVTGSCSAQHLEHTTVQYKNSAGVSKNQQSLDIYPAQGVNRPVVVFVHGGAWLLGDKDNKIDSKVSLFRKENYVFVSINYRLSSIFSRNVQYPQHTEDVADAIKWIHDNIKNYGGDPNQIVLVGHSAGAQMVSLIGTDHSFLKKRKVPISDIKGIISADTEGYDVYGLGKEGVKIYRRIFGEDLEIWKKASPLYNVEPGNSYPPFLIFARGESYRHEMAQKFARKLLEAGADVQVEEADQYSHFEINNRIGEEKEGIVTPKILSFLQNVFK